MRGKIASGTGSVSPQMPDGNIQERVFDHVSAVREVLTLEENDNLISRYEPDQTP